MARAGIAPEQLDEVLMGNVLQAGEGQAPARQAALGAGLPNSVGCTTVHKVCGSGMKAMMLAFDGLKADSFSVAVAGGMESMSNAPYLLPKVRAGLRLGHGQVIDHMFYDGLEDAYDKGRLTGTLRPPSTTALPAKSRMPTRSNRPSVRSARSKAALLLGRSNRWRCRSAAASGW